MVRAFTPFFHFRPTFIRGRSIHTVFKVHTYPLVLAIVKSKSHIALMLHKIIGIMLSLSKAIAASKNKLIKTVNLTLSFLFFPMILYPLYLSLLLFIYEITTNVTHIISVITTALLIRRPPLHIIYIF